LKLACVIHRYGIDIAGGSEAHCRQIAERLAAHHHVTVLTTCARDYVTWANAYPHGMSDANGVKVLRFPVTRPRDLRVFAKLSDEVFDSKPDPVRQEAWFRENGPETPELLEYLRAHGSGYDLVLFWSYRYYTAYFGLPLVADRAVLLPTAEEDPTVELDVLEQYFRRPAGFLFLTPEEKHLVARRAGDLVCPSAIVGSGLDAAPSASSRSSLDSLGISQDYVLYLGRVDRNKGCHTLFEYFEAHLRDGRARTTLLVAGPAAMPVPSHPGIRAVGFIDEATRNALLAHAQALIVSSPYESLSMALLEGWNCEIPALVNGDCGVLKGQVRRANGGLYYRSAREFSTALDWLLDDRERAHVLGVQGRAYVESEYRWPIVMARVEDLLERALRARCQGS